MALILKLDSSDEKKTEIVRINVRIPADLAASIKQAARSDGLSQSAWVARAIESALEKDGNSSNELLK